MLTVAIAITVTLSVKIVEVDIAILTASAEAHVVLEPVNREDFAHVTGELHTVGALVRVEVVDIDFLLSVDNSEEVATVGEANLVALLHL